LKKPDCAGITIRKFLYSGFFPSALFLYWLMHRGNTCADSNSATGDFIVDYHPEKKGLFLATGGSGHGFKFLPIIGHHIVDILEGVEGAEYKAKWKWPQQRELVVTKDGSRGGQGVHVYLTKDGKEHREEKGAGFTAKL
jgi:hypothetical protein